MSWTPGPWTYRATEIAIVDAEAASVAQIRFRYRDGRKDLAATDANGTLIAAAPDLAAAALAVYRKLNMRLPDYIYGALLAEITALRAALEKAGVKL